ncbi:MAG TPA: D-2-hydroxyacid dehydrogenase family protein [Baekduia sp.]|jgi:phosphoglycerate dehydrogenase-like enzyme
MLHVAVLDDFQGVARAMGPWERLGDELELTVLREHVDEPEALAAAIGDAEVVVAMRERTRLDAALFARLPHLRLVITTGSANVAIDVAAATAHGVTVCGTGYGPPPPQPPRTSSTAELAWALLLAVARQVPQEDRALREGRWQTTLGRDLGGLRLGVIGLGRLGRQVAGFGKAFDMDVVAWSQNLTADAAREAGVRAVSRDELLSTADAVSIHLVLGERSRGLLGAEELALMKPDAILVNTSRGPIVDEDALVAALEAGRLGGAGLDVFATEPLPADHPLVRAPRTVLTPHIGFVTEATYRRWYPEIVAGIAAWRAGAPTQVIAQD